jgi:DNA-directed RNA polymerase specialized sigma subunit
MDGQPLSVNAAYDAWFADQTPENLNVVVKSLGPIITSEIQRYSGPKPLLRARAKSLAVRAVRTYDPSSGAKLQSWVVTQMQPLSRYSKNLQPVHVSDDMYRKSSELGRMSQDFELETGHYPTDAEIADYAGLSVKRVRQLRASRPPVSSESQYLEAGPEGGNTLLPGVSVPSRALPAAEMVYNSLSARDKMIYDHKTGSHGKDELSAVEIAKRLGVSPAYISQVSARIAGDIARVSDAI